MCSGVAAAIGWPQRCLERAKVRNPLNLNNASPRTLVFFEKITVFDAKKVNFCVLN